MKRRMKPCCYPGCGALARDRYCDKHNTKANNSGFTFAHHGGAALPPRWRKIRLAVLERDQYLCQVCAENGDIRQATEVDHIVPREAGGTDDWDNLQSICHTCHSKKTAMESNGHRPKL